ncbi:class I SAM-dependent methyltransferase [Aquipuribacter nitratireducens]|uniref:Class I SAM-dependent methyltransferase n=1 Tax=Aquipuribacter nitratireducens TaxID=650104 RepID=A0ABW0GIY3_9MICO
MTDRTQHYFSAPAGTGRRHDLDVDLDGVPTRVQTADGVFSRERLDPGTAVLLRHAGPVPGHGDHLDLGCGWGPLSLVLARRCPAATVWAVDVNPRARELTEANAAATGLTNVRVVAPEAVPDEVAFAAIWSNPPIRVGKDALHALLQQWLPRLAPGGHAELVVQRNLGADSLHRWLEHTLPVGFRTARTASSKGYRVLVVSRSVSS